MRNLEQEREQKSQRYETDEEYRAAAKERAHKSHLKRTFGLTVEEYNEMLSEQGGVCAICGGTDNRRLSVDHDHETGTIRGLLCAGCNGALHVLENTEICNKMMDYLARYH